ncbi:MAG: hypothetical protein M2R45_04951 [Verrucomicrobia subdivision 3 bacterium]|nr:hypothetical protein [Limisphaerales bacterium]MCS1415612.1 hypothetical protein [Limisphaerales bacterium]
MNIARDVCIRPPRHVGVCTGARWPSSGNRLIGMLGWFDSGKLVDEYRCDSDYDILIPVSGGKDGYFKVHLWQRRG